MKKRAQLKLSFGMIFSIFLIVIFLAFAIYAIIKFVNLQHTIQIDIFKNDLQEDITAIWNKGFVYGSYPKEYYLPDKINKVCFDDENYMSFESDDFLVGETIEHIEIDRLCIDNIDGKVNMNLVKESGETLVTITE